MSADAATVMPGLGTSPSWDAPSGWTNPSGYLAGNYAPVQTETVTAGLKVVGELPDDLVGTFVRTGSNPRFEPMGRYHWFDGDGMLHAVEIADGTATYRNRWIRTRAFAAESDAGKSLWTGILEPPRFDHPLGVFKDTGNTDLTFHNGRLYATWWLSGEVYEIELPSLATRGPVDFGGTLDATVSAHPKVDPRTNDLVFFGYDVSPPHLRIGVISPDGKVVHHTPIELPGPRLQHDLAITERFDILFDMSLQQDFTRGGRLRFWRDVPSRLGVVPRLGGAEDVRWFEVAPFFGYHVINAWEEGDTVVLLMCRIDEPLLGDPANRASDAGVPAIADLRLAPVLHEYRLDLATGRATERPLDDVLTEFPRINDGWLGVRNRYAYHPRIAAGDTLLFDGLLRYDLDGGPTQAWSYPAGWYGGEAAFAPSTRAQAEDDGYVITFASDFATGESELHVLDARRVEDGPVARVQIPRRVPVGYHTEWVPGVGA